MVKEYEVAPFHQCTNTEQVYKKLPFDQAVPQVRRRFLIAAIL